MNLDQMAREKLGAVGLAQSNFMELMGQSGFINTEKCLKDENAQHIQKLLDSLCAVAQSEALSSAPVGWKAIKTADDLPKKPGLKSYEYVDCLIVLKGEVLQRPFNCEHLCWDDEHYDDHFCEALAPSHWMPLPVAPAKEPEAV